MIHAPEESEEYLIDLRNYFTPIIYIDHICLVAIDNQHAEEFFYLLDSQEQVRHYTFEVTARSIEDSRQKITEWLMERKGGTRIDYIIREKGTGRFLGMVSLDVDFRKAAWLAYEISPTFWRKGIATTVGRKMIAITRSIPWITNLYAIVIHHNKPSIRLLEKLGFLFLSDGQYAPIGELYKKEVFDVKRFQHNSFVQPTQVPTDTSILM